MEDIVKIVVTALPWFGPPAIIGALALFLLVFGGDHLMGEEEL